MLGQRVKLLLNPVEGIGDKFRFNGSAARRLDASLTTAFNRILHRQMAIRHDDLHIQSFAMDIIDLIGVFFRNAIITPELLAVRSAEKEFIARNTFVLSGVFRDSAFKDIEKFRKSEPVLSNEIKARLTLHAMPVMGVLINLCSDELGIDVQVNETKTLVATEHPQLTSLAGTLFDVVNPVTNTGSDIQIATLDDCRFELDRGLLGDHHYLITRIR